MRPIKFKTETKFIKGDEEEKAKKVLNRFKTVNIEVAEDSGFKKYIVFGNDQKVMREVEDQLKKGGIELARAG